MNSPKQITELSTNEVFVFGSNDAGRHGKGAALTAKRFGARSGVGRGPTGSCYAIATKDKNLHTLPLSQIARQVVDFLAFANKRPDLTFLLTPIGCGLAGYNPSDIAPFFRNAPSNVLLPSCFT